MPKYSAIFMLFVLGSVALPGTSGFIGEFMILIGAYKANTWVALLATTGIILGAAYMLYMYRRVIFGELLKDDLKEILDLDFRELCIFTPLIILVIWMGIWPQPFLDVMDVSVKNLLENYQLALNR